MGPTIHSVTESNSRPTTTRSVRHAGRARGAGQPTATTDFEELCVGCSLPCVGCTMKHKPHQLLIQVAARLFADGHVDLAQDVRQLANKWTPTQEKRLVGGAKYTPPKREAK